MTDHISKEHRSWNMSRIKSVDTKPELTVRSLLHRMGYRFRLNGKVSKKYHPKGVLAGRPDIVLAGHKTVVFVHGCFWHRHKRCKEATVPKTRAGWWLHKLNSNVERDRRTGDKLKNAGWKIIVLWECEIKGKDITHIKNKLDVKLSK